MPRETGGPGGCRNVAFTSGGKDPKYMGLISMTNSFKDNPGEKLGAMLKRSTAEGNGSISVWDCGVNCRQEPMELIGFLPI
jgi:hypothetical protein